MKQFTTIMAFLLLGTVLSCTDGSVDNADDTTCLRASYRGKYCSAGKQLHLINFHEPTEFATSYTYQELDSTVYYAAVYDLPESVQKKDAVFYLKFHYNPEDEKYQNAYCPANFITVKILGCDAVTNESCQSSLSKL